MSELELRNRLKAVGREMGVSIDKENWEYNHPTNDDEYYDKSTNISECLWFKGEVEDCGLVPDREPDGYTERREHPAYEFNNGVLIVRSEKELSFMRPL